jgi:O-antigen ligase
MSERREAFPQFLAAVLMLGVLVTWAPGYWPVSVLQVSIYGLAAALAFQVLIRPGKSAPVWPRSGLYIPMVLVAAWAPLQLIFKNTVYEFGTWTSSLYWLTNFVAFLLGAALLQRPQSRSRFLSALMYFSGGLVVLSILQSYTSPNKVFWLFESPYRVIGPFIYKNQFAAFVELVMPIALYRMLVDRKNSMVYAFMSATMFAAVLASASRAGTALLAIEVFVVLVIGWKKGMVSTGIAIALLAQTLVLLGLCTAVMGWEHFQEHFQDQTSGNLRQKLLKSTLDMIRDSPWRGIGLGNWTTVYPAYSLFDNGVFANAAHDDWAQWAAEGGIPFALLLLWVFLASLGGAWRHPWSAGVVCVLIHSFIDYPAREPVVGAILFCIVGATVAAGAKPLETKVVSMRRIARNL